QKITDTFSYFFNKPAAFLSSCLFGITDTCILRNFIPFAGRPGSLVFQSFKFPTFTSSLAGFIKWHNELWEIMHNDTRLHLVGMIAFFFKKVRIGNQLEPLGKRNKHIRKF